MTDNIDKMLKLMDLQKQLAYEGYDGLGLQNLGGLRLEVKIKIKLLVVEDMRKKGASQQEILAYIKFKE